MHCYLFLSKHADVVGDVHVLAILDEVVAAVSDDGAMQYGQIGAGRMVQVHASRHCLWKMRMETITLFLMAFTVKMYSFFRTL
jgi:hypothetical protein